ncbi:unnamed protein product, partial [Laminaria digitata]
GRQVSVDESIDAGEGHEVGVEDPITDAAGPHQASADEVVATDRVEDTPAFAPAAEARLQPEELKSAPVEEGLMAGGEDHPTSPSPAEAVQAIDGDTINGDEKARSAQAALVDSATEDNVVDPSFGVLEGQETE